MRQKRRPLLLYCVKYLGMNSYFSQPKRHKPSLIGSSFGNFVKMGS